MSLPETGGRVGGMDNGGDGGGTDGGGGSVKGGGVVEGFASGCEYGRSHGPQCHMPMVATSRARSGHA